MVLLLTYETILKKVKLSKNRLTLATNIMETHKSIVKDSTAVKDDYRNIVTQFYTFLNKYGSDKDLLKNVWKV